MHILDELNKTLLWKDFPFQLKLNTNVQYCAFLLPYQPDIMFDVLFSQGIFNHLILAYSDAICQHRSGSTLAVVMAWCMMAPSLYLNQCWFIIKGILQHSLESNFTKRSPELHPWPWWHVFWDYTLKLLPHLPGANELKTIQCLSIFPQSTHCVLPGRLGDVPLPITPSEWANWKARQMLLHWRLLWVIIW